MFLFESYLTMGSPSGASPLAKNIRLIPRGRTRGRHYTSEATDIIHVVGDYRTLTKNRLLSAFRISLCVQENLSYSLAIFHYYTFSEWDESIESN